ncbi:putative Major facilitator superfamily domain-containing protein [Seiridium cardinale]
MQQPVAVPTESPNEAPRIFEAVPGIPSTSRLLITSLLVGANTIQASSQPADVYFVSNFITFSGGLVISEELGRPAGPGQANWMPASYPLTQSAFVLITGRLGAVYGHKRLVLLGCFLFGIFSLSNAFCRTYESFVAIRALTGIGGGLFMPNAVSMITIMIPPGRTRNLFLGFFAASPPLGGMVGALLTGVFIESIGWKWLFIILSLCTIAILACLAYVAPPEVPLDEGGQIDYFGAVSGPCSLLLFNVVCKSVIS